MKNLSFSKLRYVKSDDLSRILELSGQKVVKDSKNIFRESDYDLIRSHLSSSEKELFESLVSGQKAVLLAAKLAKKLRYLLAAGLLTGCQTDKVTPENLEQEIAKLNQLVTEITDAAAPFVTQEKTAAQELKDRMDREEKDRKSKDAFERSIEYIKTRR